MLCACSFPSRTAFYWRESRILCHEINEITKTRSGESEYSVLWYEIFISFITQGTSIWLKRRACSWRKGMFSIPVRERKPIANYMGQRKAIINCRNECIICLANTDIFIIICVWLACCIGVYKWLQGSWYFWFAQENYICFQRVRVWYLFVW